MAKTTTIKNPTIRLFHMPLIAKTNAKGEVEKGANGHPVTFEAALAPLSSVEVPDWYAAELRRHRTWSKRLDRDNSVKHPTGAAGAFEARILARRSGKDAQAKDSQLAQMQRELAELKAKLAEVESKSDSKAKLAEVESKSDSK